MVFVYYGLEGNSGRHDRYPSWGPIFATLDLISAYHAFEIHPDDREKTAFSTKQGHWQWKRVPFGLCNAAPFFVRQIASLLAGMT